MADITTQVRSFASFGDSQINPDFNYWWHVKYFYTDSSYVFDTNDTLADCRVHKLGPVTDPDIILYELNVSDSNGIVAREYKSIQPDEVLASVSGSGTGVVFYFSNGIEQELFFLDFGQVLDCSEGFLVGDYWGGETLSYGLLLYFDHDLDYDRHLESATAWG